MKKKTIAISLLLFVSIQLLAVKNLFDLPLVDKEIVKDGPPKTALHGGQWIKDGKREFLLLDGLGSYIVVPAINENLHSFSLSMWICPKQQPGQVGSSAIYQSQNCAGSGWRQGFSIFGTQQSGKYRLGFTLSREKEKSKTTEFPQIPMGIMSQIAITYDGKVAKGFVNGKNVFDEAIGGPVIYTANKRPGIIGSPSYSRHPFYGIISHFKLYAGVIPDSDIEKFYNTEKSSMTIELKKEDKDVAYIPSDKLMVPDQELCRNLQQNPSFEQGFRFWKAVIPIAKRMDTPPAIIDDSVARTGTKSLLLYGEPNERELVKVSGLATLVDPGQEYTISFYAKSDIPAKLSVTIYTAYWPVFPANKSFSVTKDWKRFSLTFKAPNASACPTFYIQRNPSKPCKVWIDDVQLEKGTNPTPFVKKPLDIVLESSTSGNIIIGDAKADGKLVIQTVQPQTKGKLQLTIKDYRKKILYSNLIDFETDDSKKAVVPIPELETLPKGLYSIQTSCKLADGFQENNFFRFGRISPVKDDYKMKHFFAGNVPGYRFPTTEKTIDLFQLFGLGATKGDASETDHTEAMNKRGMLFRGHLFYGKAAFELDGENGYKKPTFTRYGKEKERYYVRNRSTSDYDRVTEVSRRVAANTPQITHWQTCGEGLIPGYENRREKTQKYMDLHRKIRDAIKKDNPEIKFYSVSHTNIYPSDGVIRTKEMLECGGKDIFDYISFHSYRPRPESPDFDTDLTAFAKMLDEVGVDKPMLCEEDLNYVNYIIPRLGLETTRFADYWRGQAISYDIGLGERLAAAYVGRSYLIALAHWPRLQRMYWHKTMSEVIDANRALRVGPWMTNTLANVFGDGVEFVEKIDLSDDARCYLYKDAKNRPIAALWNINEDVDREKRQPFSFKMPYVSSEAEILDMFGNAKKAIKDEITEILPVPMLIRGKTTDMTSFKKTLQNIKIAGSPLRVVQIKTQIKAKDCVAVQVANRLSKSVNGSLLVKLNGKETLRIPQIVIAPQQEKAFDVKSPTPFAPMEKVGLEIVFTNKKDGSVQETKVDFTYLESGETSKGFVIDGNVDEWGEENWVDISSRRWEAPIPAEVAGKFKATPELKGENDFSAKFKTAWDSKYFYLAVKVTDDVFSEMPKDKRYYWEWDSIQVYFDTFGDARYNGVKSYDNNDYCYNFFYQNKQLNAKRDQVPEWQLCFLNMGDTPKVKRAFKRTNDGYVYEIAWPSSELSPLSLTAGNSFGFAMMIHDNDNDYHKRMISLTPKGKSAYQKPWLWPTMLLVK